MLDNIDDMENKVNPFDSFRWAVRTLILTGFYEVESSRKYVRASHHIYRILVITGIALYNFGHVVSLYVNFADFANSTYTLVIEIPQLNLLVKILTMFIYTSRIRKLHQLIKDPIFGATDENDKRFIENNNRNMIKLSKFSFFGVSFVCVMWVLSFVFKRMDDSNAKVPMYAPFDTSTTKGYAYSVLMQASPIFWIGHGHLQADTIIAVYYSQATAQLKLLKYNLEHIFDSDNTVISSESARFQYKDLLDENIRKRFIYFIERYNKVNWYIEEVTSIFDFCVAFQLFSATITSCLVIYHLSMMQIFSVVFLHMLLILGIFIMQTFYYCFFGYLVEHESQTINTAIYFSDWVSVSPKFRRLILIAMTRWSKPLVPRVAMILPVSIATFASIVKLTYRLYTVMKSTHI